MTSQIQYANIDATFPIAGQDNNSQGFRDNFTYIKDGLSIASTEITTLQNNGLFVMDSAGLPLANNLLGSSITNGYYNEFYPMSYSATISNTTHIDITNGLLQTFIVGSASTIHYAAVSAAVVANGSVYNVGDTLTVAPSVNGIAAVFNVTTVTVVSAIPNTGNNTATGFTVGDTLTLSAGDSGQAVTVRVASVNTPLGYITSVDFAASPLVSAGVTPSRGQSTTSIAALQSNVTVASKVTAGVITGTLHNFDLIWGVSDTSVHIAGDTTTFPTNNNTSGAVTTSGTGTGATLNVTYTSLGNATTFVLQGWPTNTHYGKIRIHFVGDTTGIYTASIATINGTMRKVSTFPTLTLDTAGHHQVIEAWSCDGGVTVFVDYIGQF